MTTDSTLWYTFHYRTVPRCWRGNKNCTICLWTFYSSNFQKFASRKTQSHLENIEEFTT